MTAPAFGLLCAASLTLPTKCGLWTLVMLSPEMPESSSRLRDIVGAMVGPVDLMLKTTGVLSFVPLTLVARAMTVYWPSALEGSFRLNAPVRGSMAVVVTFGLNYRRAFPWTM